MRSIDERDLANLKSRLGIQISDPSAALRKVIRIDDHYTLRDLFFKYFYVSNDKLKSQTLEFFDSLSNDCQFKIIHGYSRNGKTTFIKHLIYLHQQKKLPKTKHFDSIELIHYDFEKAFLGSFIDKLKYFFLDRFSISDLDKRIIINLEINKFESFIIRFTDKLRGENLDNLAINIRNTIFRINGRFEEYLLATENGYLGNIHKIEENLELNVISDINEKTCGNYFIFLVFFELFRRRELILSGKTYKFLFTLDNIDDFLVHKDITFIHHPQIHLSSFLHQLSQNPFVSELFLNSLEENPSRNIDKIEFSFRKQISITYLFRTPNFLVFSNLVNKEKANLATSSERHFSDLLSREKYIHLKTVANTSSIIKRRLMMYEEIAAMLEMSLPLGFFFLKSLADNFDSSKSTKFENNVRRIYNLWNGDKTALWSSITDNWQIIERKYFREEQIVVKLTEANLPPDHLNYILKGCYINFFLFLLKENQGLNRVLYNTLYSFRENHLNGKKKNIRRIIINCIINASRQKGKPHCIEEIDKKGIGLYDLLYQVENYILNVNSSSDSVIYSFQEIEDYFSEMCDTKIDHFAHLFYIYKDQVIIDNGTEAISSYYTLDEEIKRYKTDKILCKEDLNQVRLYNNNNASYISASLLTNYELSSHICSQTNGIDYPPLIFLLKKIVSSKTAENASDFSFYNVVEAVYNNAEISVNGMIDFYCENLIGEYSPDEFIKEPLFTILNDDLLKGDFQTRLLVSRHITYLQFYRDIALNYSEKFLELTLQEKVIINIYLLRKIKEYCILFNTNLKKIEDMYTIDPNHDLIRSRDVFLEQIKIIDNIVDNDNMDFNPLER